MQKRWSFILLLVSISLFASEPQVPAEIPFIQKIGSYSWSDAFHWMLTLPGEQADTKLLSYIKVENTYSSNWMRAHQGLKNELLNEYKKNEPKDLYSEQAIQLQGQFQYFAKDGNLIATDSQSRQSHKFFEGKKFFEDTENLIGDFRVSPNHRYAIILINQHDNSFLYFYDTKSLTIKKISGAQDSTEFQAEWTKDSTGFIYPINRTSAVASELYYQSVNPASNPVLLFKLPNGKSDITINLTKDQEFFVVAENSYSHRDCYVIATNDPLAKPTLLIEAAPLRFSFVDHDESGFIIRSNINSDFYDIYRKDNLDVSSPLVKVIAGSLNTDIDSIDLYNDFYFVVRKNNEGLQDIEVYDKNFQLVKKQTFKEGYYYLSIQNHRGDFPAHEKAVIIKNSVLIPEEVFSYKRNSGLIKVPTKNKMNFTQNYQTKRIQFPSYDGTLVPLTLVFRKDLNLAQPHPVQYAAYGCYGSLYDLNYAHGYTIYNALSLMNRNFIMAIAHVRGGGDKGLHWYLAGRDQYRMNTVKDFYAGADYMIKQNITKKKTIGISSYSAGGLIIGNAISQRPDLWGAAINYMGFTDYIGSMLDERITGTAKEWDLVGDPRDPNNFKWMLPMSPQDNLRPTAYPPTYVWAAIDDAQVLFHEGVKFTAKLRKTSSNHETTLLSVIAKGDGDHHGTYKDYLNDVAQSMTFTIENISSQKN